MQTARPDVMYLSTRDFIRPGTPAANRFYRAIDEQLARLDDLAARLVITADHGMSSKTDECGRPRIVLLQELCDSWIATTTRFGWR